MVPPATKSARWPCCTSRSRASPSSSGQATSGLGRVTSPDLRLLQAVVHQDVGMEGLHAIWEAADQAKWRAQLTAHQHRRRWPSPGHGASRRGAAGSMMFLAWNCRGAGGSLRSSKMTHLARLLISTKSQVCFISETRNFTISRTSLINHFDAANTFIIPTQG